MCERERERARERDRRDRRRAVTQREHSVVKLLSVKALERLRRVPNSEERARVCY